MHNIAQVNYRGLGVKVATHCLRDSNLIPRHCWFVDCSTAHALVLSIRAMWTAVHYILHPRIRGCDL